MENSPKDTNEEIIDRLIIKVTDLEKREVKVPDYTPHFEALQKIFETFFVRYNKESEEFRTLLVKQFAANPIENVQQTASEVKAILMEIKKSLPIQHQHHFGLKTKGWIISGVILLIVTAISTGGCKINCVKV